MTDHITLPRSVVEQAIEAMRFALHVGFDETSESQMKKGDKAVRQIGATTEALRAALAAQQAEPVAHGFGPKLIAQHSAFIAPQPAQPVIQAQFEWDDGELIGTTSAPVKRVEVQDDGSYTVVIDHWPQPQPAQPVAVPQGWKLVPVEPDDEMLRAIRRQRSGARVGKGDRADWQAWLNAAPTPPAATVPKGWVMPTEAEIDEYIEDYEMRGDGSDYRPTEQERFVIKDAIMGLLAESFKGRATTPPAATVPVLEPWQPIETAPKDGRSLLLGYVNDCGKWRTVRGEWMSDDYIAENWEFPENGEAGWFETAVNCEDPPNCWSVEPTHWMPLPTPPVEAAHAAKLEKRGPHDPTPE